MADELKPQEAGGDTYLEEVEGALDEDRTLLGEVWRLDQEELDANKIAKELDAETTGFVYNYRRYIKAIVDVESIAPSSPSIARQCASALRGFAKRHRESLSLQLAWNFRRGQPNTTLVWLIQPNGKRRNKNSSTKRSTLSKEDGSDSFSFVA